MATTSWTQEAKENWEITARSQFQLGLVGVNEQRWRWDGGVLLDEVEKVERGKSLHKVGKFVYCMLLLQFDFYALCFAISESTVSPEWLCEWFGVGTGVVGHASPSIWLI